MYHKELAALYEKAKADGRLCSRCSWIITKKQWQKGIRLCAGCQDALKGVNISYGWGPYAQERWNLSGEHW